VCSSGYSALSPPGPEVAWLGKWALWGARRSGNESIAGTGMCSEQVRGLALCHICPSTGDGSWGQPADLLPRVLRQVLPTCWNKHGLVTMVIIMALG
jgi:hypothetical protein